MDYRNIYETGWIKIILCKVGQIRNIFLKYFFLYGMELICIIFKKKVLQT